MSNGLACLVAALLALGAFGGTTTLVYSTVPAREGRPTVELKLDLYRPAKAGVKSEIKVYEAMGHSLPGSSKADMIRFLTSVAGNRGYNWHTLQP